MLRDQPGIHNVKVALLAERGVVEYDPGTWDPEKIISVSTFTLVPFVPILLVFFLATDRLAVVLIRGLCRVSSRIQLNTRCFGQLWVSSLPSLGDGTGRQ